MIKKFMTKTSFLCGLIVIGSYLQIAQANEGAVVSGEYIRQAEIFLTEFKNSNGSARIIGRSFFSTQQIDYDIKRVLSNLQSNRIPQIFTMTVDDSIISQLHDSGRAHRLHIEGRIFDLCGRDVRLFYRNQGQYFELNAHVFNGRSQQDVDNDTQVLSDGSVRTVLRRYHSRTGGYDFTRRTIDLLSSLFVDSLLSEIQKTELHGNLDFRARLNRTLERILFYELLGQDNQIVVRCSRSR